MIDTLAFSKDRACQLDLLLTTTLGCAPHLDVTVLYTASGEDYQAAYDKCRRDHDEVEWLRETSFEQQTRAWLGRAGNTVCFLVDDDLFYRPAPWPPTVPFSYRASDYWYPLALDGCVYERDLIVGLLDFGFKNPNDLEAGLHDRRERAPFRELTGYGCLVGVPHNRVSASPGCADMGGSARDLNDRYLAGGRIDPDLTMANVTVTRAHEEVEYQWR